MTFEVEKPYNHYGSRGFIDILYLTGTNRIGICEVKPVLNNLGEALRQLRKAHDAILNGAITDIPINQDIILKLITTFCEENIEIIRNSYSILKNVKGLAIDLYCENTEEFYTVDRLSMRDEHIRRFGDPLLTMWEMCKNKESANDREAYQRAKENLFLNNNR